MNRGDVALALFIGAAVLSTVALFVSVVSAAAHGTVFDVTDPDRGIYRMHHELVEVDQ